MMGDLVVGRAIPSEMKPARLEAPSHTARPANNSSRNQHDLRDWLRQCGATTRSMNRAEITKYKAFYPESVYLSTVIKNLETAEPLTVTSRPRS